jgi:large conductance mechanosensitive channel
MNSSSTGGMVSEFKAFIMKGNVLDLAVAVIIGGAFGKIVTSFVENIVMPLIGVVVPGGKWREGKIGPMEIGIFAGTIIDFLIVALAIFLVVKAVSKLRKKEEREEAAALTSEELLRNSLDRLNDTISSKM